MSTITVTPVTQHVTQLAVPTPTLPPAFSTNTYLIIDNHEALLVDAGTTDTVLLADIADFVDRLGVSQVQLAATHYHRDHTQGLPWLQAHYDTSIYIHPQDIPFALAEMQIAAEQVRPLPNSFQIGQTSVLVDALPGHTHGHVHLRVAPDGVVLVGDHLAGTGSVWIGPPDGHLGPYYEALDSIIRGDCTIAGPGHGELLYNAPEAARHQKQHRQQREQQIFSHLNEWSSIDDLVDRVYRGQVVPQALAFARKTIQANLQYFIEHSRIDQRFDGTRNCTVYRIKHVAS